MPFKPIGPKPNFPELEEEILKFWEDNKIFEKSLEQTKDGKPFTFYDGPPFATGVPHYGHILASTIKDLVGRYQTMKGRFVRRRWGWDCHGLPIEEITERHLGISGKKDIEKLGIKKFNETCRSMVLQFVDEWRKTVRRIARWVDFDNAYKTMDRDYMESVWWAFKQIYDKGLVYEGRKVLLYCPRCETPISNFEVAMDDSYEMVTEEAVTVKFKVKSKKEKVKSEENTYLLAWTTTPWTLIGNMALAVGEEIEYVKVKVGDEYYILARDTLRNYKEMFPQLVDAVPTTRIEKLAKKILHSEIAEEFKGKDLVGLEYEPLFEVPAIKTPPSSPSQEGGIGGVYKVYAADFVNTEEGTGIVHTAVVYGEEDYVLGLREGLPIVPLLDEKGIFNDKAPKLVRGVYFKDAEKPITDDLASRGLLFNREVVTHSYPHCWRCDTMLFYNAIPAWFVNIQKIKQDLLKSNDKEINWFPSHLKHGRYQKSVEMAPDWNISRNRYWGNPMPIWRCTACGENKVVGSIKELGLSKNTFYFLRHGESENNLSRTNSGNLATDRFDLTDKGIRQTQNAIEQLKRKGGIDLIFTSPFIRTKKTAELIAAEITAPIHIDHRLVEYNTGIYDLKSYDEWDAAVPYSVRLTKKIERAENGLEVQKRMLEFVNEINDKYKGQRILVVTHGDPLWYLMQYFGSEKEYPDKAELVELDVSIADLHRPYIDEVVLECDKCGSEAKRITEIFDSWIEAGSMPFAEYHYPFDQKEVFESRYPAQFVAEYIAQTRAWFYIMHVIGFNLFGKAPFENVVTTGNVLNEKGEKLSKSKMNYTDPWININKYGVDSIRFYLMNSPVMQSDDLFFNERDLAITYRKVILILWNVYNYFVTYANQTGWEPAEKGIKGEKGGMGVMDRWIWIRTNELVSEVTKYWDSYDTVRATRTIEDYINDLSTWYLRRSRGRTDDDFFATLRYCLLVLAKILAPVAPYLSEEIYRNLNRRQEVLSVHLAVWLETREITKEGKNLIEAMNIVREAVSIGLAARKQLKLPVRQPLSRLAVESKVKGVKFSQELLEVILAELNVKQVDASLIEEAKTNNKIFGFPGNQHIGYFYLDTTVDQQLKLEGLARTLERSVQEMRKEKGLRVGEMVNLFYNTDDSELVEALKLFDKKKTYVKRVEREKGVEGEEEQDIGGKKIRLRLG